MRPGVVVEGEPGRQVPAQELHALDAGQQGAVHGLLRGLVLRGAGLVGLLLLLGELSQRTLTSRPPLLKFSSDLLPRGSSFLKYWSSTAATFTPFSGTTAEVAST